MHSSFFVTILFSAADVIRHYLTAEVGLFSAVSEGSLWLTECDLKFMQLELAMP